MTFEDCQAGDMVCLTLKSEEKKLNLNSKIINVVDNCLVVEPFKMNDAIIDFPPKLDIEMLVIPGEGQVPYMWQKVTVALKLYHDENAHIIKSKLPGVRMNRRANFRLFVGGSAKLQNFGPHPVNITLKDVSNSGFAIIVDDTTQIPLHTKITVEFVDNSMQKYFELSGRPIRKVEMEKKQVLYGCILDKRYSELENYINQKQMASRPNARK